MAVRVGALTVRHLYEFRKASGVIRPRPFQGDDVTAFTDRSHELQMGRNLERRGELVLARAIPYEPVSIRPDQIWANWHTQVCQELDRGEAGRRARDLLLDHLSPSQRQTAERFRYFDVWVANPHLIDLCLTYDQPVELNVARFRFLRGFPNGNILLGVEGRSDFEYSICLHPLQPYPTDDICLSQLMHLLSDPDEFIQLANVTTREKDPVPIPFQQMFQRFRRFSRTQLILPFLHQYPMPENVITGSE